MLAPQTPRAVAVPNVEVERSLQLQREHNLLAKRTQPAPCRVVLWFHSSWATASSSANPPSVEALARILKQDLKQESVLTSILGPSTVASNTRTGGVGVKEGTSLQAVQGGGLRTTELRNALFDAVGLLKMPLPRAPKHKLPRLGGWLYSRQNLSLNVCGMDRDTDVKYILPLMIHVFTSLM